LIVLLGLTLQFYRTSRETVDVEAIVRVLAEAQSQQMAQLGTEFAARHEKEVAEWKAPATQAVTALTEMRGKPNAPAGTDAALRKLRQGDTKPPGSLFQEMAERETEPKKTRVQAYRNMGTLLFLQGPARAA